MRSACCVTLYNKVILRDELIEGDEQVRKGGKEVAHHGRDAFRVQDLRITSGRVMHDFRAKNFAQLDWIRRLITSSCHARAIAVLSTCVVAGQAGGDICREGGACPYATPELKTNEAATSVFMSFAPHLR